MILNPNIKFPSPYIGPPPHASHQKDDILFLLIDVKGIRQHLKIIYEFVRGLFALKNNLANNLLSKIKHIKLSIHPPFFQNFTSTKTSLQLISGNLHMV